MANRYMILNTTHPAYQTVINKLTELSAAKGIHFMPRLSLNGSKALIQIKSEVVLPETFEIVGIEAFNNEAVSGKSDEQWAWDKIGVEEKDEWKGDISTMGEVGE